MSHPACVLYCLVPFVMSRSVVGPTVIASIIDLHVAGVSNKDIAAQKGLGVRTVQRWVKRFQDGEGAAVPAPRPKAGRPRKTSPRTLKVIHRQLKADPALTAREIKEKNTRLLGSVSIRTIQQRIHDDLLLRSYKARKKPMLSQAQKKRRLVFAKKYAVWTLEDWKRVLWTDEATFCVTGSGAKRVYRPAGSDPHLPQYTSKTVKHPASLMVWGSFSYGGVGELVILPKNVMMNQYNYYELLNDVLSDSFEKSGASFFMHDGAPCHTARSVREWLSDCDIPYFNQWPGNSPDLNPLENLWALMKQKLQHHHTSSIPQLEAAIRQVWGELPLETLQKLALSVPKRLKDVVKRKGNTTKY